MTSNNISKHSFHDENELRNYALYGKYRDVKADMRFTASRMNSMSKKLTITGQAATISKNYLLAGYTYLAATFTKSAEHLSLMSIGETNWTKFSNNLSTTLGYIGTGKFSGIAGDVSNQLMGSVGE